MELNPANLVDKYVDGELDEVDGERLRAWLAADPRNARAFVRHVFLHRQLREIMLAENVGKCLAESAGLPPTFGDASSAAVWNAMKGRWRQYGYLTLAVLLVGVASSMITWRIATHLNNGESVVIPARGDIADAPIRETGLHTATLVSVTNCRWDQALSTGGLKQGSIMRSGESLHLLEGVAEINSTLQNGGKASLQLEGPLAMTFNNRGMPSLMFGHLTGAFTCDYDQFTLETPLGRVTVSGDASLGVIAAANKVELHVFTGAATLELWAMGIGGVARQLTAAGGTSLSARVDFDGAVSVDRGASKESGFITPAAVAASRLRISPAYVSTVVAAKPVAYWRFEGDADGIIRNEMSNRFHCRMVGDAVRWHTGEGNSTVEFGMTAGPGYLISDDVMDGAIGDDYSVEAWVKPTYYHHGALVSLIQWSPAESPLDRHRLHLELVGPNPGVPSALFRSPEFHPGRIRFIHQSSACYSSAPYRVRVWQHIAAVREHSMMRLYADGKMVATAEDGAPLGNGLRVLMGQLFPRNPYLTDEVTSRLFVGELDEVALYDCALGDDEIKKHVQLARPESDPALPISTHERL